MGEFVSVNPNLRSNLGHSIYQDRQLRAEAARRGLGFGGLAHADCTREVLAEGGYHPCFRVMMTQVARNRGPSRLEIAASLADDWSDGVSRWESARVSPSGEATFFQYLGHAAILPPLVERLQGRFGSDPSRRVVMNLFSGYFEQPLANGGFREFLEAGVVLDAVRSVPWLRVVTDSSRLAADLEKATGWVLPVLPMMPSQDFAPAAPSVAPGRPAKDQPVRIVFPTHAEPGRGFDFLRPWAEELAKNGSWKGRIQVTIRQYAPWRKDLRPLPRSNDVVRWVEGDLSGPAYQDLLENADVVLLPYSAVDFHYRTSSILAEAFSLGKPVICVEGSWLADQVRAVEGGWVLPELSKPALLHALQEVLRARDQLRSWPGRPAMDRWLEENSVESFFSGIVQDVSVQGRLDLSRFLTWLWKPAP